MENKQRGQPRMAEKQTQKFTPTSSYFKSVSDTREMGKKSAIRIYS
jgi:hypothetical protein